MSVFMSGWGAGVWEFHLWMPLLGFCTYSDGELENEIKIEKRSYL